MPISCTVRKPDFTDKRINPAVTCCLLTVSFLWPWGRRTRPAQTFQAPLPSWEFTLIIDRWRASAAFAFLDQNNVSSSPHADWHDRCSSVCACWTSATHRVLRRRFTEAGKTENLAGTTTTQPVPKQVLRCDKARWHTRIPQKLLLNQHFKHIFYFTVFVQVQTNTCPKFPQHKNESSRIKRSW